MIEREDLRQLERERRRPSERVVVVGYVAQTSLGDESETWQAQLEGRTAVVRLNPPINYASNVFAPINYDTLSYIGEYYKGKRAKDFGTRRVSEAARLGISATHRLAKKLDMLGPDQRLSQERGFDPLSVSNFVAESGGTIDEFTDVGEALAQEVFVHRESGKKLNRDRWQALGEEEREGFDRVVDPVANSANINRFTIIRAGLEQVNGAISNALGIQGCPGNSVEACATGISSIADAYYAIRSGRTKFAFAGGLDFIRRKEASVGAFASLGAVSRRNDDPLTASRPLGLDRDGFVMSEGVVVLLLASYEAVLELAAKGHRLPVKAEILNVNKMQDGGGEATELIPENIATCGYGALYDAQRDVLHDDIDVIGAHLTSTPYGDRAEAQGYRLLFGKKLQKIPIIANKANAGHGLGEAGALTLMSVVQAIEHGEIPPFPNTYERDPEFSDLYLPSEVLRQRVRKGLASGFGFGGFLCSVVVGEIQ